MELKDKAIKIKGKDYVQVKDRLLYLADVGSNYSIETEYQYYPEQERKMWVVKAKLTIGNDVFTGLAQEVESGDYKQVNYTSALENAETSAVGRACAMAGIGVLDSIASADEMHKAMNRVQTTPTPNAINLLKVKLSNFGAKNEQEALKILEEKAGVRFESLSKIDNQTAKELIDLIS